MNTKEFTSYADKEAFVQGVFSNIAKHYDMMNTLLSFGQDYFWRKFAVEQMNIGKNQHIIDVACGTCVFTKEALRQEPTLMVEALDFNREMLNQGRLRIDKAGLLDQVNLVQGDAMALPYEDNSFDAAMSGFAMRNVPDIKQVLKEMQRVVKPGGKVVVLELAKPSMIGFKQLYNFYFSYILPIIGKLSKDNSSYAWLPESLRRYPHQSEILEIWKSLGYEDATYHELTGGIVAVHVGTVPIRNHQ
ncbi:ubiquinone/menaquinone biosynthesis methyltransferase [Veillonella agrestimuris]|uniref:ubiquinone/menaquinone biosynthesis methyltransferase n=1 Tax=Veillonella agrestimuris TaxID=2941340 RepID=UPI00203ED702|nr:ubiquinone/menaquinone biosynthesis methyltransferase [Veillonella agrestimuris]